MGSARTRTLRIALLAAAVVAAGVLPATTAAADVVPPVVTYEGYTQDDSLDRLFANDPTGTGVPVALSPTVHVDSYDVSEDGSTLLAAVSTRDFSSHYLDTSWGVVLVSRATGTTHLLGTDYDSAVELSADGRRAYWLSDGRMMMSVDGGPATRLATPDFNRGPEWRAGAIAISPDGSRGAVLFQSADYRSVQTSLLASPDGGGPALLHGTAVGSYPMGWTFIWLDDHRLLFSTGTPSSLDETTVFDVLGGSSPSELGAVYDVSRLGTTWYAWHDSAGVTSMGTTTDPSVPPADWTPRADGSTTYGYDVTATVPPPIGTADNRAVTTPRFALTASSVRYGQRASYTSYVYYLQGYGYDVDYTYWNCRGTLKYSIDRAVTWRTLATTSCATLRPWPTSAEWYANGYTQILRRNTWFKWSYPGDALTKSAGSGVRLVTVTPSVTVKVATSGSLRKVYGAATRTYGTAVLQKYSSTLHRWSTVSTVRLNSAGAFSFGYKALGHGSYRVVVAKDAYWNAAIAALRL